MIKKILLSLSVIWMLITLVACGVSGDVSDKKQVQSYKIVLDAQSSLSFALPSDLMLDRIEVPDTQDIKIYAANHPGNTEKDYLGAVTFLILEDMDGSHLESELKINRLKRAGFKLLQQDSFQQKDLTLYWFQYEITPDPYNINQPSIQNNIIVYEKPWLITINCHYPIGDQDSSLPLVAQLFIETVKISR